MCKRCKSSAGLAHVWVAAYYDGPAKKVVHMLKFDRAKAASRVIGEIMADQLPELPDDTLICHIPTANNRIRGRGYDQARLIAREIARRKGCRQVSFLVRRGKSRQVGAGRRERFQHLEQAFDVRKNVDISGIRVLLVDDVLTTGATLEAAAKVLKRAGVRSVDVAVFAQP